MLSDVIFYVGFFPRGHMNINIGHMNINIGHMTFRVISWEYVPNFGNTYCLMS